jgi:hypothetical protein
MPCLLEKLQFGFVQTPAIFISYLFAVPSDNIPATDTLSGCMQRLPFRNNPGYPQDAERFE